MHVARLCMLVHPFTEPAAHRYMRMLPTAATGMCGRLLRNCPPPVAQRAAHLVLPLRPIMYCIWPSAQSRQAARTVAFPTRFAWSTIMKAAFALRHGGGQGLVGWGGCHGGWKDVRSWGCARGHEQARLQGTPLDKARPPARHARWQGATPGAASAVPCAPPPASACL